MAADDTFDIIAAGGGTAGCALASRLKQGNPSLSIALIEKGPDERTNPLVLHASGQPKLEEAGLNPAYLSVPQRHLNNRIIKLHAGNLLSGSSGVNIGVWMRPHKKDLDYWAELLAGEDGVERWSYRGLLPYFKQIETHWDHANGDREAHGFDGPFKTRIGPEFPLRWPLHDGLTQLGFQDNPDHLNGESLGIGKHTDNWTPLRQPAGSAYDLSGVTIMTNATVHKILLTGTADDDLRATGVQLVDGRVLHANKEVVLSSGAYRTPQLLMLSGIGPRAELSRHGVETLVDNPHVGQNLMDHSGVFIPWKLDTVAAEAGLAIGHPKYMSNPLFINSGPIDWVTIGSLESTRLKHQLQLDEPSSTISDTHPPLEQRARYWLMAIYYAGGISGPGLEHVTNDGNHITLTTLNLLPTSRGSVTLSSSDPLDPPLCDPNYYATHHDRYVVREALRQALRLAHSESMEPYLPAEGQLAPEGFPFLSPDSRDEDLDARIRHSAATIHHGMGTASMGKVVDAKLRVKGVQGLRVCDASVFPAPVAATPQATVYAVAESCSDLMLEQYVRD